MASNDVSEHSLESETELRIELNGGEEKGGASKGDVVTVELLDGSAEIFGLPLVGHRLYRWGRDDKIAIFTWYGCRLRVSGLPDGGQSHVYVSDETPMVSYINTHAQLDARRDHAVAVLQRAASEGNLDGRAVALGDKQFSNRGSGTPYRRDESSGAYGTPSPLPAGPVAQGPRVLVCGPADSGKSSLCSMLIANAVRLGRVPMFIDLDTSLVGSPPSLPSSLPPSLPTRLA